MFADLGAFGKRAIQLSWLFLAYPCLLITYSGQAAFISMDESGEAFTNPFFYTLPDGTFYFSIVIAVLAAIVASQALITSSFQLISQLMRLSYFPHIKVVHTSTRFHDQVYMPFANWLLMIGTVVVAAVYNNVSYIQAPLSRHLNLTPVQSSIQIGTNYTITDYQSWPCLWCMCHNCNLHHDLHGFDRGSCCLAHPVLRCPVLLSPLRCS